MGRRFEFSEGSSNKFWEIERDALAVTARWGRIGTDGQRKTSAFASEAAAQRELDALVAQKTKKGYREVAAKNGAPAAARAPALTASDWRPTPSGKVAPETLEVSALRERGGYGSALSAIEVHRRVVVAAGTQLLASSDGKTFRPRERPNRSFGLTVTDDAWYAVGEEGQFHVSRDRGASWKRIKVPYSAWLFTIQRDAKGRWWIGCDGGTALTSTHPERGWKALKVGLGDKVLGFCDVGDQLFIAGSGGLVVGDGVKFKRSSAFPKSAILTRITVTPSGALVAIGDGGLLARSVDGGKTWKTLKSPAGKEADLEDLAWVAGALFVVGGNGAVLRSTDEGKTFQKLECPTRETLWGISSWGDGALIAGERGVLLKLAAPKDAYWRGTTDEFAPAPPHTPDGYRLPEGLSPEQRQARFTSAYAAAEERYRALSAKLEAPDDENETLATAIDAAGEDDAGAWEVYSDWLQSRGEARGELAAVQRRLRSTPKDSALKKAEKDLLKTHASALLGGLAGSSDVLKLAWRDGFIATARIANSYERSEGEDEPGDGAAEKPTMPVLLGRLLEHPSGRFLRELTMGIVTFEDNSYAEVIKTLSKRSRPSLRKLFLGDFESEETELSWSSIGNATPLFAALPHLTHLTLRSGSMSLGEVVHPRLETLVIETGGLDRKTLKAILKAQLPSLQRLSLQFGMDDYGGDCTLGDVLPLLDSCPFPRLEHLGLTNCGFIADVVRQLPKSKVLSQLKTLDLSKSTLGDEGAHVLATYAPAYRHLESLTLDDNFLTKEGVRLVKGLCASVSTADQKDDDSGPDDRYVAVGE